MPLPEEYGSDRNIADLPKLFPQIIRIFRGVWGSYAGYKIRPKPNKTEAPSPFFKQLEAFARQNGALAIEYAKVTPDLILKDFVVPHDNAIIIISEMKKEPFIMAPSVESMVEVAKVYADTTIIANKIFANAHHRQFCKLLNLMWMDAYL